MFFEINYDSFHKVEVYLLFYILSFAVAVLMKCKRFVTGLNHLL